MEIQNHATVEEYIADFPANTQKILEKIRAIIKRVAPEAQEKISYGIPTYRIGKKVIHFGGYQKHIGLYPGATGVAAFTGKLNDYETSKGTIRFNLDKPIPYDLIEAIALFCFGNHS